jgi:hypothetical protein
MKNERSYPITSLHKDDLRDLYRDARTDKVPAEILRKINALSDADMRRIASKLADAFCNCCYWDALRVFFEACSPMEDFGSAKASAAEPKSSRVRKQKQEVKNDFEIQREPF